MCISCQNGGKPIAALVARVSTIGQTELSLDSQIGEVKPWLEGQGYEVSDEYILKFHWTSQELLDCPHIERLLTWVRNGEIHAVGCYHEDRLAGSPSDVWGIYGELEKRQIPLLYKASPRVEGIGGEIMTTFTASYKRWQVYRARAGAKDGLRGRAKLKGLPPSPKNPFGYEWQKENGTYTLVTTADWMIAQRIWHEYLSGGTIRSVATSLTQSGVPTIKGGKKWEPSTIAVILKNPLYAGRYYALRWENAEPTERRSTSSYGKSSVRRRCNSWETNGDDGSVLLDNVKVENPAVSWEEFMWVQDRLRKNQERAMQGPRAQYMLKSIIMCMSCNKHMAGKRRKSNDSHTYACRECQRSRSGPALEEQVWQQVTRLLKHPEIVLSVLSERQGLREENIAALNEQLEALGKKEQANMDAEQRAFRFLTDGSVRKEIYDREMALKKAERTWIEEERGRVRDRLAAMEQLELTRQRIEEVYATVVDKLSTASSKEQRFILECLSASVHIWPDRVEVEIAVPQDVAEHNVHSATLL